MLMRLHELQAAEEELARHVAALAAAEQALQGLSAAGKEHAKYGHAQTRHFTAGTDICA